MLKQERICNQTPTPINPVNAPDPWEREALESIFEGVEEVSEITDIDGKRYLRFLKATANRRRMPSVPCPARL